MHNPVSTLIGSAFVIICTSLSLNNAVAQIPQYGLVAYYPFSGDADDASGNNNNPTAINATLCPDRFGNPDSACLFNGSTSHIDIPSSPSLNPTTGLSITAWIRIDVYNLSARLLQKGYNDNQYNLRFSGEPSMIFEIDGPPIQQLVTNAPSAGVWHHVAATYNGSEKKLYVDGECVAAMAVAGSIVTTSDNLSIGNKPGSTNPIDVFNGAIDEVRIYNRGLTDAEVLVLAGLNISELVPCSGPLSGGTWKNHGQYVSTVVKAAAELLSTGVITEAQKAAIVSEAAHSSCGK